MTFLAGTRALIVDLPYAENEPPVLLKKSDGSTLYATRDIAANLIDSYQQLWRQPFDASSAPKTLDLPRSGKSDLGSILFDNAMFQIESAVSTASWSDNFE